MLKTGASVNFFVFCGGTNFGFTAGANGNGDRPGDYAPTVTSYDYDGRSPNGATRHRNSSPARRSSANTAPTRRSALPLRSAKPPTARRS